MLQRRNFGSRKSEKSMKKHKIQAKVKAKKKIKVQKLANPYMKKWKKLNEDVSLNMLKQKSNNFVLGLHKVDSLILESSEKIVVFSFEKKELKPVQDFFADQVFDSPSVSLIKIKGYLQKKFCEKFSLNGNLTCFASKNPEQIKQALDGVECSEDQNQLMLI